MSKGSLRFFCVGETMQKLQERFGQNQIKLNELQFRIFVTNTETKLSKFI